MSAGTAFYFLQDASANSFITLEHQQPAEPPAYYRLGEASVFWDSLNALSEERRVLKDAVANLWSVYRFNQHYIGYLAGGVSEEDFNDAAQRYVQTPKHCSKEELWNSAQFILPLIQDGEVTPKDLAVILNADTEQLELAMGD